MIDKSIFLFNLCHVDKDQQIKTHDLRHHPRIHNEDQLYKRVKTKKEGNFL